MSTRAGATARAACTFVGTAAAAHGSTDGLMAQPDMRAQLPGAQGTWQDRWLALTSHAPAWGAVELATAADATDATSGVVAWCIAS